MHTSIHTHTCIHTVMHIYIHHDSCAQTYTNTYTYRQARLACMHTQAVKHPYVHTHACTHGRMHAHTHITDTYTAGISLRTDMDALPCALLVCRLLCPDWWGFPAVAKKWEVEKSESVTLRHHLGHALFWWPQRALAGWLAASVWVLVWETLTASYAMFQLLALDPPCFSCQT